jgi:DNA-binding transcriptional regulator/RsmH inhibitor MraZ
MPDRQWRLRLPPELVTWAGVSGEVMIVGVRDHLEIWASEKWEQYVARCDPQYDQLAEMALAPKRERARETVTDASTGSPAAEASLEAPSQPR